MIWLMSLIDRFALHHFCFSATLITDGHQKRVSNILFLNQDTRNHTSTDCSSFLLTVNHSAEKTFSCVTIQTLWQLSEVARWGLNSCFTHGSTANEGGLGRLFGNKSWLKDSTRSQMTHRYTTIRSERCFILKQKRAFFFRGLLHRYSTASEILQAVAISDTSGSTVVYLCWSVGFPSW